jgi:methylenetetrahydrofolate dehydrogenase (NADP+)/methenyltetrahydrofolate cyclohydrolase
MILLDGKTAAAAIKKILKEEIDSLRSAGKRPPHLAAVLVGSHGASETYVASKVKSCAEAGFLSTLIRFNDNVSEKELLDKIKSLNEDPAIDGILVQLPLPKQVSEQKLIGAIDPSKDVDGFHPVNAGRLVQGLPAFIPATPYGILLLLEHYHIETKGKHAVILGRSNIVGRPLSILLSSNIPFGNCTVTLCHSHTQQLDSFCRGADILVAALGRPGFVTAPMVKEGAVVIDVGITRIPDTSSPRGYRISGDVAFDEVAAKAAAITPVPGGVGLMTIAGLLKNTMQARLARPE